MPLSHIRAEWLARLHSTEPSDRSGAESAVRRLYRAAGFDEPQHFVWFDSPFAASWAVALLVAPSHFSWGQKLSSAVLSAQDRQRVAAARSRLQQELGIADWDHVLKAAGGPLGAGVQFPPVPGRMFSTGLFEARYSLSDDIAAMIALHTVEDELQRAEQRFWGGNLGALMSALHCPTTDLLIGQSFVADYPFSMMAHDEEQVGAAAPPPIMESSWDVARSSGMWWPFDHIAIMSERPAEIHVDEEKLLHRGDGPAVVFRDGWLVYAWKGKAVPERWILHPEAVPSREFKGFDPSFGKYVASRIGRAAAKPQAVAPTAGKSFYDRYQHGECRQVWTELLALGPAVRQRPHAADALAVAEETMRRVDANLRTVVRRLESMGYVFKAKPHVSPASDVRKNLENFEKEAGPLPLSLRAFYQIVGEVNLLGRHPALSPRTGEIAPDPLLVYGFEEGLVEYDEEDDGPSAITIAPDDLHKADTSGGDAYEMKVPDSRADGELLNERHGLFFVEYLRLAFAFGGFPGYEGVVAVPAEVLTLKEGLLEF